MQDHLIKKYNVPGPRYTSYPTVPYWDNTTFSTINWQKEVIDSFKVSNDQEGISLYIHLPFCESMCTFCGCNKRITKNHLVEHTYIAALLKEWALYTKLLPAKPKIKELHLGGGTPTFFSPKNLTYLISALLEKSEQPQETIHFSFEGHPNNTTKAHLQALFQLGFRRVSFGIQDFDPIVQNLINRVQTYESVKKITEEARVVGFTSVNYDIIYGLPSQKLSSVIDTIEKVSLLMPDRIAFYSYAHVPWIKGNGQRKFTEADLPTGTEKQLLYESGKQLLNQLGYLEIGMDHFALAHDSLWKSLKSKSIHRNFMGYTESKTRLMLGLGVSSISDAWTAFAQNEKKLEAYYKALKAERLPLFRGHILNNEDLTIRQHILELMCLSETTFRKDALDFFTENAIKARLDDFLSDNLIELDKQKITISKLGKTFLRNICMAFDLMLLKNKPETQRFSMTI